MKKIKINLDFVFNLLFPILSSFVIAMSLGDFSNYYDSLNSLVKVPRIVFPLVWGLLYVLMGYVGYKLQNDSKGEKLYYLQLFFNLLWTPLFFGLKNIWAGAINIAILLILVIMEYVYLLKKEKKLSYYWLPYVIWTLFATFLNVSILFLN